MRLILVRHGQTDWNKEYRAQGQADLPLNESGRMQAEAIAQALKDEPVEAIYSSPLLRAYQTAQAISHFHSVDIIKHEGLKEMDLGYPDGTYFPDVKTEYPEFFKAWTTDPASARWPGGETLPELQARAWGAVQDIVATNRSKSVVVTSHFFVLLTLFCKILDLGLSDFRKLNISVGGISIIEFAGDKPRLTLFNDTCHLG